MGFRDDLDSYVLGLWFRIVRIAARYVSSRREMNCFRGDRGTNVDREKKFQ
jgi:hypothetical protein